MPFVFEPFHQPKHSQRASEEAYMKIRQMILSRELENGERLVERKLAEKLGFSRTPVREALKRLQAEGLAKQQPYAGLVVSGLNKEDVLEFFEIREVLEALAVEIAISHRDKRLIDKLAEIIDEMKEAIETQNQDQLARAHSRFHQTIYAAAKRPKLIQLILNVQDYSESLLPVGYRQLDRTSVAFEEHKEIFESIEKGDVESAINKMRTHIRHAKDAVLKFYEM